MLSEQPMTHILVIRVQIVNDHIRIARVTGCENNDLEIFCQILQEFARIRADIDPSFDNLSRGEDNGQFHIRWDVRALVAVDQRLVQI